MTPTAPPGRDDRETTTATPPGPDAGPRTDQHPAIAETPLPVADDKGLLDRVVFTVSAVLALAFVAWGFLSPSGLGSASGTALTWIEANLGWLFVTLALAFVVYVCGWRPASTAVSRWAATTRRRSSGPPRGSR